MISSFSRSIKSAIFAHYEFQILIIKILPNLYSGFYYGIISKCEELPKCFVRNAEYETITVQRNVMNVGKVELRKPKIKRG